MKEINYCSKVYEGTADARRMLIPSPAADGAHKIHTKIRKLYILTYIVVIHMYLYGIVIWQPLCVLGKG